MNERRVFIDSILAHELTPNKETPWTSSFLKPILRISPKKDVNMLDFLIHIWLRIIYFDPESLSFDLADAEH